MKKLQFLCTMLLIILLSTGALCSPALAIDAPDCVETITFFADGSYLVTSITYDSVNTGRAVKQKSGTKHHDYYNASNQIVWTFRVHGTFSYDGHSAEATFADYSYDIYDSAWSFNGASASYSGATATAEGSFTYRFLPQPTTVSLTCSPKGVLS